MKYTISDSSNQGWYAYILCTCWLEDMKSKVMSLSKNKMLKYFSEDEHLNEFHLLLLEHIIQISAFVYYVEDGTFEISLFCGARITVTISEEDFEDIVTNCTADLN